MNNKRNTLLLLLLGSSLEYYDFVLYGLLASHISQTFFPSENNKIHLMQALSIFALGYLVRPLGGTILGIIGDFYSKVKVLTFSMLLMGISTLFIGLLPSYEQIGIAAPLLLLLARVAQGISFSSEIPGAIAILSEAYTEKKVPSSMGFLISSTNFGFVLASLIIYLVHLFFSDEQILKWGWRIPFILGGILAFISYYFRINFIIASDSKEKHISRRKSSLKMFFGEIMFSHFISILQGVGITSLLASGTMFFIYLPHLLEEYYTAFIPSEIRFFFFTGLLIFIIFSLALGRVLFYFNVKVFFSILSLTFPIILYFLIHQLTVIGGNGVRGEMEQ